MEQRGEMAKRGVQKIDEVVHEEVLDMPETTDLNDLFDGLESMSD
jgi:hypothetical protein